MTSPQTVQSTKYDLEKEDTLNKLAARVVWKERPVSREHGAEKEESETFKNANVKDAIAGILHFNEDALATTMTTCFDDGKPYSVSRMATTLQVFINKKVLANLNQLVSSSVSAKQSAISYRRPGIWWK